MCACLCVSVCVHVTHGYVLVSECVRAVCLHLELPCRGDQGHFLSQVQPLASQAASFWLPHLLPSNRALVGGGVCEELWGPGRPPCPSSQPSNCMSLGERFLNMGSHQSRPSSLTPQAPTPRSVGLQHGPWEGQGPEGRQKDMEDEGSANVPASQLLAPASSGSQKAWALPPHDLCLHFPSHCPWRTYTFTLRQGTLPTLTLSPSEPPDAPTYHLIQ